MTTRDCAQWTVVMVLACCMAACGEDTAQMAGPETASPALECGAPLMVCSETCVDPRVDPEHCGVCGESCGNAAFCDDGQCVARCGEDSVMCGESCVDTQSSHANCGACGEACGDGEYCQAGDCVVSCAEPRSVCDGGCVDLESDPAHCGACGEACDDEESCVEGACEARASGDRDASVDEDAASCCEGSLEPGCASAEIEACVCAVDEFCCTLAWDEVCADYVTSEGCGTCAAVATHGSCEPSDSTDELPGTLSGTLSTSDSLELTCGSLAEPDVVFAFTAPEDGTYTFDSAGSEITDTVLALLDGTSCTDLELDCNDDDGDLLTSRITAELTEGQEVLLVIESWGGEEGDVELSVAAGTTGPEPTRDCDATALSSTLPATVSGSVSAEPGALLPSCATDSQGEVLYTFTAPDAGTYRFDTSGSSSDTIVQILDEDCEGEELACNDDSDLGGLAAVVDVTLTADQVVIVNVDSFTGEGDYTLTVSRASTMSVTSCCQAHGSAGCEDAAVQVCVCADDDYCCENAWDDLCVYAVDDLECGGGC